MKIDPKDEKNKDQNTEEEEDEFEEQPKGHSKTAIALLIIALLGVFAYMVIQPKHSTSAKKDVSTSSVKKVKKEKKAKSSTSVSSSSVSSSSSSTTNTVDMKGVITSFFTAYQQYNTGDTTDKARATSLVQYSSDDVVNALMPGALNEDTTQQVSYITTYKLTKPLEIQPYQGSSTTFSVVVTYSVSVNSNSTNHVDTYIVNTGNNKITSVSQKSAVAE